MFAFKLQKIVVTALVSVWIFTAHIGARFINSTFTFLGIEEAANGFIDVVLLMAQYLLVVFLADIVIREFLLGRLYGKIEVLGETLDVKVGDRNQGMTATITRTLGTIETRFHTRLAMQRKSV
jgi:hypothetical protein